MTGVLQSASELDAFYSSSDPWGYAESADDHRRRTELLSLLPDAPFGRTLDIGCGNGFITLQLPGDEVVGIDLSERAIGWAREASARHVNADRFRFEALSLLDPAMLRLGQFDLICITGVLYPQYIGKAASLVRTAIDALLKSGGYVASCHIREWAALRLPYTMIDAAIYPYREFVHQLEVMRK